VDAATAGNIHGTVKFTGTAPAPEPLDMSDEPTCQAAHGGKPTKQTTMVGPDGGLANVFVYVKEGLDPALKFPIEAPTVIDQSGCEYKPHVVAMSAGETLTVRNSDSFLHNINATPTVNRGFNRSQPQQGMEFQTTFAMPEVMIPVRCDVHGWMSAFIGVTSHPYHAVTAETGTFALDRLPPGNYVVEAWHEKYGTSTQNVTVATGQTADVTFTFSAASASAPVPMGPALVMDHHTGTLKRVSQQ
jgi:plastocyanin